MSITDYPLGSVARDTLTDTEGIVVGHSYHLTGCERVGIRPMETAYVDDEKWCYVPQLESVESDRAVDDDDFEQPNLDELDVDLGVVATDTVTGIEGHVGIIMFPLYNCPQALLIHVDDPTERDWVDTPRLTVTRKGVRDDFNELQSTDIESETGSVMDGSVQRSNARVIDPN